MNTKRHWVFRILITVYAFIAIFYMPFWWAMVGLWVIFYPLSFWTIIDDMMKDIEAKK